MRKIATSPENVIEMLNILAATDNNAQSVNANCNTLKQVMFDAKVNGWEWTTPETIDALIAVGRNGGHEGLRQTALTELSFYGIDHNYADRVIDAFKDIIETHPDNETRKDALLFLNIPAYYDGHGNNERERPHASAIAKIYIDTLANKNQPEDVREWAATSFLMQADRESRLAPLVRKESVEQLLALMDDKKTEPDIHSAIARSLFTIHKGNPGLRRAIETRKDEINAALEKFSKDQGYIHTFHLK